MNVARPYHALDRPVARIGVDRRPGKNQREFTFSGKGGAIIADYPAALAQTDEIDAAAEIVDRDDDFGEIIVDLEILHVVGRRFPVGQRDVAMPLASSVSIRL